MTKASFGNGFRGRTGVPAPPMACARLAHAKAGATEAELNAWFGWAEGSRESATYVRGADRAKSAERAAERAAARMSISAPPDPVRGSGRNKPIRRVA